MHSDKEVAKSDGFHDRFTPHGAMRPAALVTGATGFLGRELLWKLMCELPPEHDIVCLIREQSREGGRAIGGHEHAGSIPLSSSLATPPNSAERRLHALLAEGSPLPEDDPRRKRVFGLEGDICKPDLGLPREAFLSLAARVTDIYHGAATVRFDLPLDEARRTNVDGTREMLALAALAQGARLRRFHYIGTAFVAGTRKGLIREDELQSMAFNNTYEATKYEAESLVQKHMQKGLPVTIYRPSIIVGDSQSGYTSSFKVMYWPLKVFARGLIPIVPAARASIVDLVPVDFVVAAIWALGSREDSVGRCYHLAAGPEHATSIGAAIDIAAAFFGVYKPLFVSEKSFERYIRPIFNFVLRGKRRQALDVGRVYIPYLNYRASFDTRNTRRDLAGSGVAVPEVSSYFRTLLRYCVQTDWGKRAANRR